MAKQVKGFVSGILNDDDNVYVAKVGSWWRLKRPSNLPSAQPIESRAFAMNRAARRR
jgi:hypothetical protein